MVSKRYVRQGEILGVAIQRTRDSVRDAQRPTGTEKARTMETAIVAAEDSEFAKQLAEQLRVELEAAQVELAQALAGAAAALEEAGLARSEAATAVAEAQSAAADAEQAINDALEASNLANGAVSFADRPPVAGDADGKPLGAVWYQLDADGIVAFWELQALGWIARDLTETVIPKIQIGEGTYGDLDGIRLTARTILADRIAALSLTANEISANAITAVKIAANAVIAEKILAGAVTTDKLNALAVTAEKLAVGSVVAEKIATGAIVAGKIAADAIDGMVITGAILRTAPTGQRMQFDVNGMSSFNAAGIRTAVLAAGDGSFQLLGAGGTVNDPSGSLSYSGVGFGAGGRVTPGGLYKRSAALNAYNLTVTDRDPDSEHAGSSTRVESYFTESAHSVNGTPSSPRTYANAVATANTARIEVYKTNGVSASVAATLSAFFDTTLGRDSTRLTAEQLQIALGGNCGGPLTFFGATSQLRVASDEIRSTITNGTPLNLSSASGDIRVTAGAGKKIRMLSDVEDNAGTRRYKAGRLSDTPIVVMMQAYASIPVASAVQNIGTVIASTSSRQSAYASGTLSPFTPGAHSITVKEDGVYEFYIRVPIPATATARAFVQIASFDTDFTTEFGPGVYNMTGSWMGQLNAGDTVTFCAYQTTGAARTVTSIIRAAYLGPRT